MQVTRLLSIFPFLDSVDYCVLANIDLQNEALFMLCLVISCHKSKDYDHFEGDKHICRL